MKGKMSPETLETLKRLARDEDIKIQTPHGETRVSISVGDPTNIRIAWPAGGCWLYVQVNWDGSFSAHPATEQKRAVIQSVIAQLGRAMARAEAEEEEASKEARPKDTDEVAEFTSGTFDDVHGGDSASGEVPDGQSGGGEEMSSEADAGEEAGGQSNGAGNGASSQDGDEGEDGASDLGEGTEGEEDGSSGESEAGDNTGDEAGEQSGGAGTGAGNQNGAGSEAESGSGATDTGGDAGDQTAEGDDANGEAGEADASNGTADEAQADANTQADAEAGEQAEPAENVFRRFTEAVRKGANASGPSTSGRRAWGGTFASIDGAYRPERSLVTRLRRVFARLVFAEGEGQAGPRWDYRRAALKTAGYLRTWGVRERKPETGRPGILVLADISGSMNAFASEVIRLGMAACELGVSGADVILVAHSNGHPYEWALNGRYMGEVSIEGDEVAWDFHEGAWKNFYKDLISRYSVRAVISAADWDGEWLYKRMAQHPAVKVFFWLDVWSSSMLPPTVVPFPPRWVGEVDWPEEARGKVSYAFGCGTAEDAVIALERMLKKQIRR